jgi:hypothetical protein
MVPIVFLIQGGIYYHFVFNLWYPRFTYLTYLILGLYHLFTFMFSWSYLQMVISDPGEVPIYWGFRVGDPDNQRKKY